MPMFPKTLRRGPAQFGHSVSGSSVNACTTSRCSPQSLQRYSYVGIRDSQSVSTRMVGVLEDIWGGPIRTVFKGGSTRKDRMTVRKAVIPAAGLGTRFLPTTKAQPKEMLPVVDKPAIQ